MLTTPEHHMLRQVLRRSVKLPTTKGFPQIDIKGPSEIIPKSAVWRAITNPQHENLSEMQSHVGGSLMSVIRHGLDRAVHHATPLAKWIWAKLPRGSALDSLKSKVPMLTKYAQHAVLSAAKAGTGALKAGVDAGADMAMDKLNLPKGSVARGYVKHGLNMGSNYIKTRIDDKANQLVHGTNEHIAKISNDIQAGMEGGSLVAGSLHGGSLVAGSLYAGSLVGGGDLGAGAQVHPYLRPRHRQF